MAVDPPTAVPADVPAPDVVSEQSPMDSVDKAPMGSVDKALRVLQELAAAGPRGRPLAELAARVGVNKPTLHRTLSALRYRGFAQQDADTGHYLLGAAAIRLADDYLDGDHLPHLLRPVLVALCSRTEELIHLGVLSGTEVAYLDKVEPSRAVRVWSAIGRHAPAARTALGRALIAYQDPHRSAMAWYLGAMPATSTLDEDTLWRVVQQVRTRGYATEREENEPGISCLGVPLLRAGRPVAAISITAPADRMGARRIRELSRLLPSVTADLLPAGFTLPAELGTD